MNVIFDFPQKDNKFLIFFAVYFLETCRTANNCFSLTLLCVRPCYKLSSTVTLTHKLSDLNYFHRSY